MKVYLICLCLVSLCFVLICENALGYSYDRCLGRKVKDASESVRFRAGRNSFPEGSARRSALNNCVTRWNEGPSEFVFSSIRWGDRSVGRDNGQHEVWFSTNDRILDGAAAIASSVVECWEFGPWRNVEIVETDIIFDNRLRWSFNFRAQSTKTAYGGRWLPFEIACLHEMGHALGLNHVNYRYNVMGDAWRHLGVNGGNVRYYVGEDTGNGAVFLYGEKDVIHNDVAVTHWQYDTANGEYSVHKLTEIFTADGSVVMGSEDFDNNMQRYCLRAGSTYQVQFSYENNGVENHPEVNVGYYISTDDAISTRDRRVRTRVLTLNRNRVYTQKHTLTLPDDLVVGQTYYVGVIVDYTGDIDEINEINNQSHLPIEIVP